MHYLRSKFSEDYLFMGSGGGQVVSVPAFYSDDPSSNPTFVKFVFEKNKNKQKEARVGPFLKKSCSWRIT